MLDRQAAQNEEKKKKKEEEVLCIEYKRKNTRQSVANSYLTTQLTNCLPIAVTYTLELMCWTELEIKSILKKRSKPKQKNCLQKFPRKINLTTL